MNEDKYNRIKKVLLIDKPIKSQKNLVLNIGGSFIDKAHLKKNHLLNQVIPKERTISKNNNKSNKTIFLNSKTKVKLIHSPKIKKSMSMTILPSVQIKIINHQNNSRKFLGLNSFERMKKYKIIFKKKLNINEPRKEDKLFKLFRENGLHYSLSANKYVLDERDSNFIAHKLKYKNKYIENEKGGKVKSNKSYSEKKDKKLIRKINSYYYSTTEQDDDDKMTYKDYMKMQQYAIMNMKPKIGDFSYDLINYLRKIESIRKKVVNDMVEEVNRIENRYNIERPKEDFKFETKDQGLIHHKWKNLFHLNDYQNLFGINLKGKISDKSYKLMMKKFKEIYLICFAEGNTNFNKIRAEA